MMMGKSTQFGKGSLGAGLLGNHYLFSTEPQITNRNDSMTICQIYFKSAHTTAECCMCI